MLQIWIQLLKLMYILKKLVSKIVSGANDPKLLRNIERVFVIDIQIGFLWFQLIELPNLADKDHGDDGDTDHIHQDSAYAFVFVQRRRWCAEHSWQLVVVEPEEADAVTCHEGELSVQVAAAEGVWRIWFL